MVAKIRYIDIAAVVHGHTVGVLKLAVKLIYLLGLGWEATQRAQRGYGTAGESDSDGVAGVAKVSRLGST